MQQYKYRCKGWRKQQNKDFRDKFVKYFFIYLTLISMGFAIKGYYGLISDIQAKTTEINVKQAEKMSVEQEIRLIAEQNDFQWTDYLLRLANCESKFKQYAIGDAGKSRGIFQIHSGYHPEVSSQCAFNVKCATEWTMWRINSGHQKEWTCDRYIK